METISKFGKINGKEIYAVFLSGTVLDSSKYSHTETEFHDGLVIDGHSALPARITQTTTDYTSFWLDLGGAEREIQLVGHYSLRPGHEVSLLGVGIMGQPWQYRLLRNKNTAQDSFIVADQLTFLKRLRAFRHAGCLTYLLGMGLGWLLGYGWALSYPYDRPYGKGVFFGILLGIVANLCFNAFQNFRYLAQYKPIEAEIMKAFNEI